MAVSTESTVSTKAISFFSCANPSSDIFFKILAQHRELLLSSFCILILPPFDPFFHVLVFQWRHLKIVY